MFSQANSGGATKIENFKQINGRVWAQNDRRLETNRLHGIKRFKYAENFTSRCLRMLLPAKRRASPLPWLVLRWQRLTPYTEMEEELDDELRCGSPPEPPIWLLRCRWSVIFSRERERERVWFCNLISAPPRRQGMKSYNL